MTSSRWRAVLRRLVRAVRLLALLSILALACACPYAGRYLIVSTPLDRADAIVVLSGGSTARWLEATDLYREGLAPLVVLSPGHDDPAADALRSRGIAFPLEEEIIRNVMTQIGVPAAAIETMPEGFDNTAHEAVGTRAMAKARGWTRVLVVTSPYHTRRALFAFERELRGTGVSVQVKASRHEQPRPDGWWRSRSDLRMVLSELQRLLAYRLGLGA